MATGTLGHPWPEPEALAPAKFTLITNIGGTYTIDFNEKWTTLLYNAEDDSSKTAAKAAYILFMKKKIS